MRGCRLPPQGSGPGFNNEIRHENFDRPVRLKCPVDNESNEFYRVLGFTLFQRIAATETKRALNQWVVE
jgi:hypothetical protein